MKLLQQDDIFDAQFIKRKFKFTTTRPDGVKLIVRAISGLQAVRLFKEYYNYDTTRDKVYRLI